MAPESRSGRKAPLAANLSWIQGRIMDRYRWWWRGIAAALILATAGLHLRYLCYCPLDLAPDEAHYWHWSRGQSQR